MQNGSVSFALTYGFFGYKVGVIFIIKSGFFFLYAGMFSGY